MHSSIDASVNHVRPARDGGFWESRFVQREPGYFICYLSSHSGCNKACRFCHLTATGQTMMTPATLDDYLDQARAVFETYRQRREEGLPAVERVHFNFMARGEPLANSAVLNNSRALFDQLQELARQHGVDEVRFKISSIIPKDFTGSLDAVLSHPDARLYYSLYSMSPAFRRRWLPKAMAPEAALDLIAEHQRRDGRTVCLHWAYIAGENDGSSDVAAIERAVTSRGIRAKFNLVRYNPHDARHGHEPTQARLDALFTKVSRFMEPEGSRIVPRVGADVAASCGMFVEPAAEAA